MGAYFIVNDVGVYFIVWEEDDGTKFYQSRSVISLWVCEMLALSSVMHMGPPSRQMLCQVTLV